MYDSNVHKKIQLHYLPDRTQLGQSWTRTNCLAVFSLEDNDNQLLD